MDHNVLTFKAVTLEDKEKIDPYIAKSGLMSCEANFATIYIWGGQGVVEYAECAGCLWVGIESEKKLAFYPPFGDGDIVAAARELAAYGRERGKELAVFHVEENQAELLRKELPELFDVREVRDDYDYIYEREKLVALAGKKFHGKRGHLAKFKRSYAYEFRMLEPADFPDVLHINYEWCKEHGVCEEKSEINEFCAVRKCLEHYEELGAMGGILRVDGAPAAYTIATRLYPGSEVADIHFEKAIGAYMGIYPAINHFFAEALPADIRYLNREDDMGLEGLRKAKLSYYPDILLRKYRVELKHV